jgi:UDP-N-acetylmuramoylalanine--D-glutamate ligase
MTSVRASGIARLRNRRVAVWGTGREGKSVIRMALGLGADVTVVQDPPFPANFKTFPDRSDGAGDLGVAMRELTVRDPGTLDEMALDVLVVSPGVSRYRPEIERLRSTGIEITSATAMWLEDFSGRAVVGITGSKGKSMTAVLTAKALEAAGVSVGLGGNIGTPITDFYDVGELDTYVVEVSSFQAAEVTVSPRVGVLTLIAPDHLDWHGTYDRYVADKLNLFAHGSDLELAVNSRSSEAVAATDGLASASRIAGRHLYGAEGPVRVSAAGDALQGMTAEGITVDGTNEPLLAGVALRGRHNLDNLCGAITATRLLTGHLPDFESLAAAISTMDPLPSRLATIATHRGIEFVDDALASNPAGTIAALEAFSGQRLCLIAGGHDRGTSFSGLTRTLEVMGNVTLLHLGDAGDRMAAELATMGSSVRCLSAGSVAEAVESAVRSLGGGDGVVLLSPAAPTPASLGTYMDRSTEFKRAVERVTGSTC